MKIVNCNIRKLYFLLVVLFIWINAYSQNPGSTGSIGLFHTHTGRVFEKGRFDIYANMNFFTKLADYINLNNRPEDFEAHNAWLIASNLSFTYGVIENFDITLSSRLYQDTHHQNKYNFPGDIFLSFKGGSFDLGKKRLFGALMGSVRIPTGEVHNYLYAEYASGAFEYGISGALSYYSDPYFLDRSVSFHYNLGWWNHNEAGTLIHMPDGSEINTSVNSSNIQMAFASIIPFGEFQLRFELAGILYLTKPDTIIYSAEEWAYFTPSIRYMPVDWMSIDLGLDVRISPAERQWTGNIYDPSTKLDLPKNFAPWKVQMGLNFNILPASKTSEYRRRAISDEQKKRIEFYELVKEEQKKAEDIEDELELLRRERRAADEEIEELRKLLEEEG